MNKIRVFFHTHLKSILSPTEMTALQSDFKNYKATGKVPDTFGRDALYNHTNSLPIIKSEEVAHIHLTDNDNPWPLHTLQFNRTSDEHLIYCQGYFDKNCYLLMAILTPDAHEQALNRTIMYNLGKMAEKFRNQY